MGVTGMRNARRCVVAVLMGLGSLKAGSARQQVGERGRR